MSYGEELREEGEIAYECALHNANHGKWRQKDGTYISLRDMDDSHIRNCINLLQDRNDDISEAWKSRFSEELEFRDYIRRIVR